MIVHDKQRLIDFIYNCLSRQYVCTICVADMPKRPNTVLLTPKVYSQFEALFVKGEVITNGELLELWLNQATGEVEVYQDDGDKPLISITGNERWGSQIISIMRDTQTEKGSDFALPDEISNTIDNVVYKDDDTVFGFGINGKDFLMFAVSCAILYALYSMIWG